MKHLLLILFLLLGAWTSANAEQKYERVKTHELYTDTNLSEVVDGVETVDRSIQMTDEEGNIVFQKVFYKDGSEAIFNSYFSINDLNKRKLLISYDNKVPIGSMVRDSIREGRFVNSIESSNSVNVNEEYSEALHTYESDIKNSINNVDALLNNQKYVVVNKPTSFKELFINQLIIFMSLAFISLLFYTVGFKKGKDIAKLKIDTYDDEVLVRLYNKLKEKIEADQ